MLELNKIYKGDCLQLIKQLPDDCIDVIITSPPYNKAGFNGSMDNLSHMWNIVIGYNNDASVDFKDEEEYQKEQIELLNEFHRVIKEDGSVFYNHKIRVKNNSASNPFSWIEKSKLNFRQMITWDRGGAVQIGVSRYMHTTELIFWLSKNNGAVNFVRSSDCLYQGEVWRFPPRNDNPHPAPFPIELPNNILQCIPNPDKNKIVLDPYSGSGTTLLSAKQNGFNYIGFELFDSYIDMANKRLGEIKENLF